LCGMVVEKVVRRLRSILEERFSDYIVYAYVFGSVVEGRGTCESDVDVALRFYDSIDRRVRWNIIKFLLADISEDVDIVDLERVSPVLRMAVYSRGKLVYCRDRWILFLDQNRTLKLYNDYLYIARPYYRKMVEYIERRASKEV